MRLNTANRSFVALVALSVVPYVLVGAGSCALVTSVVYSVTTKGWSGFTSPGQDLRPALAFFALIILGGLLAVASLVTQAAASRRLAARVRSSRLPTPPEVRETAAHVRLGRRIDVVDDGEPFSFTYGFFVPRVALSRGLVESLSADELQAVLAHEHYHVRNWDPAKVLLARALPRGLFSLPVLSHLRRRYVAGRELAADRRAIRACGERPLAGALYKVVRGPAWPDLAAAAAIGGPELLDVRVAQLETGREPPIPPASRGALVVTALGVGALLALLADAFVSLDDPFAFMRMGGHTRPGVMHDHDHGPWGMLGFVASTAPWLLLGWWLYRRARRRRDLTTISS